MTMTRGGNDASGRGGDRSSGNGGGCHDNMPLQACTFNRSARCRQGGQLLRWSCRTNWGGEKEVLTAPPIECKVQLTTANHGMIKLTSVDLKASVLLTHVSQVFNYGADYLGLLKAGLVAGGIVPLEFEKGCLVEDVPLKELLGATTKSNHSDEDGGKCIYGLELTTNVHNIPKGSRLAMSTNLLGSIIAISMRATSQISSLVGTLTKDERRLVAARPHQVCLLHVYDATFMLMFIYRVDHLIYMYSLIIQLLIIFLYVITK